MGRYAKKDEPSFVVRNFRMLDDSVAVVPRDMQRICGMSKATFWREARRDPDFPKLRNIAGTRRKCSTVGELRVYLRCHGGDE